LSSRTWAASGALVSDTLASAFMSGMSVLLELNFG
jgi:hypothetical protein